MPCPPPIWQAPDDPAAALQAEQAEIAAALEAKKAELTKTFGGANVGDSVDFVDDYYINDDADSESCTSSPPCSLPPTPKSDDESDDDDPNWILGYLIAAKCKEMAARERATVVLQCAIRGVQARAAADALRRCYHCGKGGLLLLCENKGCRRLAHARFGMFH